MSLLLSRKMRYFTFISSWADRLLLLLAYAFRCTMLEKISEKIITLLVL